MEVVIVEKDKSGYSPDRLLGDIRTGDTDGVREDEYGLCLSLSIVEAEPTKVILWVAILEKERKRQRIVSIRIHSLFIYQTMPCKQQHPVSMYATLAHSLAYGLPEWSHYKINGADGGTEINGRMIWSQWLWRKPVWCVTEGTWKADEGDKLKHLATGLYDTWYHCEHKSMGLLSQCAESIQSCITLLKRNLRLSYTTQLLISKLKITNQTCNERQINIICALKFPQNIKYVRYPPGWSDCI